MSRCQVCGDGHACRDTDGVTRCRPCSYAAWLVRERPGYMDDAYDEIVTRDNDAAERVSANIRVAATQEP